MKTKTNFQSRSGRLLAEMIARYIVSNEPFANRDECIDEIRELVCEYSDIKAKAPVSALIRAEERHRLNQRAKSARYNIKIQEEVC